MLVMRMFILMLVLAAGSASASTIYFNPTTKMYFADGHFFWFTCERIDSFAKRKLRDYPTFPVRGFIPMDSVKLFQFRESFSVYQCWKAKRSSDAHIEKYGTADQMMRPEIDSQ